MKPFSAASSVLLAVFLSVCEVHSKNVIKFNIEEEGNNLLKILLHPKFMAPSYKSTLGTFKYINCGTPADLINVTTLTAIPDPISFPGTLGINFAGVFRQTLQPPLKTSVELYRQVGDEWIKIPCIGSIGSCSYDDLCELLQGATCPDIFVNNGVPCKCPFTKGSYKLPNVSFDIDAAVFPPGDYHAKGTLVTGDSGTPTGCVELYASFA